MSRLQPGASLARLVAIGVIPLLLVTPLVAMAQNPSYVSGSTSSDIVYPHPMAYAWYFGYFGDTFRPQTQLGITPSLMVEEAKSISNAVGGPSHLALVTAIAEAAGNYVTPNMFATEKGYVEELRQYAGIVGGWLSLRETNLTSTPNVYDEVSTMVNNLGVNAIWFDFPGHYETFLQKYFYKPSCSTRCGDIEFNRMMQNLVNLFPHVTFFLNMADRHTLIRPMSGTTWAADTYFMPGPASSTTGVSKDVMQWIETLNKIYPGHLIFHFDASARGRGEPMGLFSDLSNTKEVSLLNTLLSNGLNPPTLDEGYNLVIPIMGGPTYGGNHTTQGRLYNSFSIGLNDRRTLSSFVSLMQKYYS